MQQFAYTSGKNATDSAMIIDAMDLMYTGRFDGFCLVSSDSDFTRLAQRLREEGLTVYGFGERKTPEAFVQACDKFIYTEVLRAEAQVARCGATAHASDRAGEEGQAGSPRQAGATARRAPPRPCPRQRHPARPRPPAKPETPAAIGSPLPLALLRQAIEEASDDNGWAFLGSVGSYLTKVQPDFDPRLFGHKKLSDLFKQHPRHFAVEERGLPGASSKKVYVKFVG